MKVIVALVAGVAALSGCHGLLIEFYQEPCQDINLSDPGDPTLLFVVDGQDLLIQKSYSFVSTEALFHPDVEVNGPAMMRGYTIEVDEGWDSNTSTSADSPTFCYSPGLRVVEGESIGVSVTWMDQNSKETVAVTGDF